MGVSRRGKPTSPIRTGTDAAPTQRAFLLDFSDAAAKKRIDFRRRPPYDYYPSPQAPIYSRFAPRGRLLMRRVSMKNLNDKMLFWASFLTLIAAGMGFSIRGAILGDWGKQFGFTMSELGTITGGGLVGFGITIILLSFLADRVGYGPLMVIAFVLHFSSGVVTLAATPVFKAYGKDATYWCLYIGMFMFALGNGTCEAVINPLTATLFPREKTHWLNILHAGWPGGLIVGALLGLLFRAVGNVPWEVQISMFLVPTLLYGLMMFGRPFPRSEAAASGVTLGTMLLEFTSPILLLLLLMHAMVGYVELGTDSWIANITGRILENPEYGLMLFIWTSGLMFVLRFFAGPIVHRISPLGLLFVSSCLGCVGLLLLGQVTTAVACVLAATVYGFGKTFLWPTMLGVVSERFPRGGALTLGAVGGVGALSAGLLGTPGIGYKQDFFASHQLQSTDLPAFQRYRAEETNRFLFFPEIAGLDGSKVATLNDDGKQLASDVDILRHASSKPLEEQDRNLARLYAWWQSAQPYAAEDRKPVENAGLHGGRMALTYTAAVPGMMALGYLLLIGYFWSRGGYKAEVLAGHKAEDEKFTGGVEGPAEM
jgi:MFS family permease